MAEKTFIESIAAEMAEMSRDPAAIERASRSAREQAERQEQKAARKVEDDLMRRNARIQLEEADKRDIEHAEKNLGTLSDQELRAFTLARYGY